MPRGVSVYDEARLQGRLWQPTTIAPNLVGWWDAADLSTISSPSGVSEWRDKSGNSRNFSQATGSKQPTLNIGELNGKNTISFNKTANQIMSLSNFPTSGLTAGIAVYMILKYQTITFAGNYNNIQGILTNNVYPNGFVIQDRPDLSQSLQVEHITSGSSIAASLTGAGDNQWKLLSGLMISGAGGGDIIYVNGGLKASGNWTGSFVPQSGLILGGVGVDFRTYNGSISEIIIVSNTSNMLQQVIEGYMSWKWGLQSSISPTHHFYNRPPLIGAI